MKEEQIHIPINGSMAFARLWHARKNKHGMVLIVHDLADHSQRYQNFALFLTHHGYSVVAYDLRGHGFSALSSMDRDNRMQLKKNLHENPEFGYMPGNGWPIYLDDLGDVLKYVFSRYSTQQNFLIGHGMGGMIIASAFSVLSRKLLNPLTGAILAAPLPSPGLRDEIIKSKINSTIKQYDDTQVHPHIDRMILGRYSRGGKTLRTEQDWISSEPGEVDAYIADPLCGNPPRLGLYKTVLEGRNFVYSRKRHPGIRPVPLFIFSGRDDPASAYGRGVKQLNDLFHGYGWQNITTQYYDGRHDLFHDKARTAVYADCLTWMQT